MDNKVELKPIELNMKKAPPKPPRGPNNYTQEIERRARSSILIISHLALLKLKKAEIAQLVEREPSKFNVAGSNPVFRSNNTPE